VGIPLFEEIPCVVDVLPGRPFADVIMGGSSHTRTSAFC
jgi:hypothetical protein